MTVSYPRLAARTLRFTLGLPRNLTVSPDGRTVRFVRTPDGLTRTGQLWELDVETATESVLVDPVELLGSADEDLSPEERARRERSREGASGIVGYDVDETGRWATFALSGRLWATHLGTRATRELPSAGAVIDPRLDPTGRRVAYASGGALHVVELATGEGRVLVAPDGPDLTWGQAEFIAAEEMDRMRGFWWGPDGRSLLVQRTDESPVDTWFVGDPEHPERASTPQRYPAAGTANAAVTLWHVPLDGSPATEVCWDRAAFEYLARVSWTGDGPPLLQVLSRDQRRSQVLRVDPSTGGTDVLRDLADDAWIELGPGPRCSPTGALVTVEDVDGWSRVVVDGAPISPPGWQVRGVVEVLTDSVLVTASQEPTEVHVVRFGLDKSVEPFTTGAGVHGAVVGGDTTVIVRSTFDTTSPVATVHRADGGPVVVRSVAEPVPLTPQVHLVRSGPHDLRTAVLFPSEHVPGTRLPILMDPYGGPGAQRVLASGRMFAEAQWLADQGFCVVVADGRGTPGRGHAWVRTIKDELASVTLQDQVDALAAVVEAFPEDVDPRRVGITGWSYGGYLAALAVLARPDLFHAAVAGAPVTEWRLYDTCYTERYLGDPRTQPEVYDRSSLLPLAAGLEHPLMLIHGLADDNVVAAHTLRLSSALLAAGRPHTVLPLSGVTHMTPDDVVAENLKLLQVRFLREHLA